MQAIKKEPSIGNWVSCDSRSALIAQSPEDTVGLATTDSPNTWGYIAFGSDTIIPIGYANMGLIPSAVKLGHLVFVGINELLICYDWSSQRKIVFTYKMPTVFHEFVRFDQDNIIVRDEIGFVGISYDGNERWNFCIDIIADYEINQSIIVGTTDDGKSFEFHIPGPPP